MLLYTSINQVIHIYIHTPMYLYRSTHVACIHMYMYTYLYMSYMCMYASTLPHLNYSSNEWDTPNLTARVQLPTITAFLPLAAFENSWELTQFFWIESLLFMLFTVWIPQVLNLLEWHLFLKVGLYFWMDFHDCVGFSWGNSLSFLEPILNMSNFGQIWIWINRKKKQKWAHSDGKYLSKRENSWIGVKTLVLWWTPK